MIKVPTVEELFKAGAHFGHLKAKSHPKSRSSVFNVVNGIYIINLDNSRAMLESAYGYLKREVGQGKQVLLLGTKKQAKDAVLKIGQAVDVPYVNNKWLGGMLTNFTTIKGNLKKLEKLEQEKASSEFTSWPKKAQAMLNTQLGKLHKTLDGIKNLNRVPDILIVVDINEEKTAVAEAKRLGIPIVGIADTNADPTSVNYPIVVNDDSFKTIELVLEILGQAITEGRKMVSQPENKEEAKSGMATDTTQSLEKSEVPSEDSKKKTKTTKN